MADIQSYPSHHDDDRREAISDLISSVAEEQEALARILDAEHEKVEKNAGMRGVDVDDLVEIDKSVQRIIEVIEYVVREYSQLVRAVSEMQDVI